MQTHPILSRLESVRATGPDRWIARCPAHDDKSPSLSIRQDGERILLYCFTGCEVSAILAAMGLTWADICPPREISYRQALDHIHHRQRGAQAASEARPDARRTHAKWVLTIAAADIEAGKELSLWDRATIEVAREVMSHGR